MSAPEAFVLLTVPDATLTAPPDVKESGTLNLVCVTVHHPDAPEADRDVYLMMQVNDLETPIDPAGTIQRTDEPGSRTYTFHSTDIYPADRVLKVPADDSNQYLKEDLETFDSLLAQYSELRPPNSTAPTRSASPNPAPGIDRSPAKAPAPATYDGDLRGHLVAINQDTGEVIGQVDDKLFNIREDPRMHERGHEDDTVFIEVPEELTAAEEDANAMDLFIQAIPPEEQDWITTGATIVSHAISKTTSLLLTTISAASSLYMASSSPSPHAATPITGTATEAPKALVFLTSEETRKGLSNVHAVSSTAVAVSTKTVSVIDGMIRRAMGGKPKQNRLKVAAGLATPKSNPGSAVPSRSSTPAPGTSKTTLTAPPPYSGPATPAVSSEKSDEKPVVPEILAPSPAPPPLPPRAVPEWTTALASSAAPPPLPPRLRKRDRAILSLDLILATLDHETRRFLDESAQTVSKVVGHKYGAEAGESSMYIADTAKNIGLVYVDMRGIGRRALLRRVGSEWVKARIRNS